MRPWLGVVVALLSLAACASPPEDPEGTLDRVTGGTLRAGISAHDPWTTLVEGEPAGIEVELIEDFAAELDSTVEWTDGSEQELVAALEVGELDVVVAGFDATSPWASHAAFTHPYVTTQLVVGFPDDYDGSEVAGAEVAAERGTEAAGLLGKTDAEVVLVDDIASFEGPVAVDDYLLPDLDLSDRGLSLSETDHVMAVRLGENGWMVELEKYLLENAEKVDELLEEETP